MRLLPILTLLLIASTAPVRAQELYGFDRELLKDRGTLSPAQQMTLQRMREAITLEVSRMPADEWAGSYVLEDGPTSGAQFDWSPQNGFLVWWYTCSHGARDQINFGTVTFRDNVLHVVPTFKDEGAKVYPIPLELVPVKWGEQHYLVPLDQLIAFCYAARNAGRSPELNAFFIKQSDRESPRPGQPQVPEAYKKYFTGKPIQATIVDLKSQQSSNTLTLDAGRIEGIVPGMKFFALTPRNVFMAVEVTDVTDHNAEAYVMILRFKTGIDKEVKPKVGWRLTSRAPRRAFDYFP